MEKRKRENFSPKVFEKMAQRILNVGSGAFVW